MGDHEGKELFFPVSHSSGLVAIPFVVKTHNMQYAVNDKAKDPFVERNRQAFRFLAGFFKGYDNITHHVRGESVHVGKGNHVGRPVPFEILPVEQPYVCVIDKKYAEIPIL